jgi:Bacterial Ig-like domain (group 3)/FG-GAP-like repeat
MKSIVSAVVAAALLCSVSTFAQQPPSCRSIQWTLGQPAPALGPNTHLRETVAVDYDGDGALDVVGVVDQSTTRTLAWWKGNGNGTFLDPVVLDTSFWYTNILLADATGDGLADILTVSSEGLILYPNTGSGYGAAIEQNIVNAALEIAPVNVDADPEIELVVTGGGVAIFDDVATSPVAWALVFTDGYARSAAAGDFDDDGYVDISVVSILEGYNVLEVFYGDEEGLYEYSFQLPFHSPYAAFRTDLDEDGRDDLVVTNWEQDFTQPQPGFVSIHRNNGTRSPSFSTLLLDEPGKTGDISRLLIADVSGDGHLDLVASGSSSGHYMATALGRGNGTFRTPAFFTQELGPSNWIFPMSLTSGDFDGDNDTDLLMGWWNSIHPLSGTCATQLHLSTEAPVVSVGQNAVLHAHVSGVAQNTADASGTVTLLEGDTILDTKPLGSNGRASFTLSDLAAGEHSLRAEFSGNATIAAANSSVVVQKVTFDTTRVTISAPPGPIAYGATLPMQVRLIGAWDDFVTIEIDGQQSLHYTGGPLNRVVDLGTHTIRARFRGSQFAPPSEWSDPVQFTIEKAVPTVVRTGDLAVRNGSPHSLSFQVSGAAGAARPQGGFELFEGSNQIAGGTINDGFVTLDVTLPRGTHFIRASYSGDERYYGYSFFMTLTVLPNLPLVIEATAMPAWVEIAYVLPPDTNPSSLQLLRRPAGTTEWTVVSSWNPSARIDGTATRGVVYEYQLNASLNSGSPMTSNIDTALRFTDDVLQPGMTVKRIHFAELRTAVNLMRTQASLPPFNFEAGFDTSPIVRAVHLTGLRAALAEARQALGMVTPAFESVTAGTVIRAMPIRLVRDLAR